MNETFTNETPPSADPTGPTDIAAFSAANEGSTVAQDSNAGSDGADLAIGAGLVNGAVTVSLPDPDDAGRTAAAIEVATTSQITINLNAIEQLALFWGGDTGTKIRNHVGRIRDLLPS